MPPITITISSKPQAEALKALKRSPQVALGKRGKLPLRARYQVTPPNVHASAMPGTMPAMNNAPTEVLVATEYITITIEGGIKIPKAPDVVITPAPKALGKPALTMAGIIIEPMATTVAGDEPDTAANKAHASTPARPRPPYQWPTMLEAKLIMRLATPP